MSGGRLVVLDRAGRDGKRFPLAEGLATLGCDPACDIRIMLPTVSPHHATVVVHANQTVIRNVCADETLVNGRGVSVAALRHGDVISIGGRQLRWEYADPDARRPQAPEPALHVPRRTPRAARRGSGPAPARARDPALQLRIEMAHRASMPGSAGGKQVAVVQPQRRPVATDTIDKTPPRSPQQVSKRPRSSKSELDTPVSEAEQESRTRTSSARPSPKSPLASLQSTTKASLWIESRKSSPSSPSSPGAAGLHVRVRRSASAKKSTPLRLTVLKRAQSARKCRVTKIEGPLTIDHTKQAAIRLMTGHTPKSKPSSPSFVVKKPSPVRRTPRSRNSRATPGNTPGDTPGNTTGNTTGTSDNTHGTTTGTPGTPGNTPGNTTSTPGNTSSRRSGGHRTVTILEITDSDGRNSSLRNSTATRLSGQRSPKKSFGSTSPRKSALKDPSAKRGARKTESIKFDLSNLEGHSDDLLMLGDSTRASYAPDSTEDDDITLRFSESSVQSPSPCLSPSPRRSIHSRSSRILEKSLGSSPAALRSPSPRSPPSPSPPAPQSPRSRRTSRISLMVQSALADSDTDTTSYSRRTTKSATDTSQNTTVATAYRTRTLSTRTSRNHLESYSIVDLVSVDTDESAISASMYGSVGSAASTTFGTPQNTTGRKTRSTIDPTLLGSSTPYVKGRTSTPRSRSNPSPQNSSKASMNGTQSTVRSSRSRRSKSLSTPENTEESKKHISVNSTRISRTSRSRSRLNDSDMLLLEDDDNSPRTSRRISTTSKSARVSSQTADDTELTPTHSPAQENGTSTPENTHSPEEASTPVLSIQSLLDSSKSSFTSQKPTRKSRPSFNTKRKTIGGVSGPKTRVGAASKSLSFSARKTRLRLSSDSVEILNNKNDDSEIVTPKSALKLLPEGVKNKHSTAKKPQSKRSIIDDLNESDIVKQLFSSPVKRKLSQSMTEFSRKQLFDDDSLVRTARRPTRNTIAATGRTPNTIAAPGDEELLDHTDSYTPEMFVSPITTPTRSPSLEGIKLMFAKTTPENDLRNVRGVKGLLRTPRTRRSIKNDLTNVSGVKQIFARSPKNRLSDVRVKEVFVASPKNDLRRVTGVKSLFQVANKRKSPRNELDDLRGVKKLFKTNSPANDLRNVSGVKRTLRRQSPKNDLGDVRGVKRMFRREKRNDLSDVSGVEELFNLSNYSSATVSTRAESLFDQMVGNPKIRAVYSKTFSSKTVTKSKGGKAKSLHVSLDKISASDNDWLEQELNKRLQIKNYLDSLKSANTSKANTSKANTSKANISKANTSKANTSKANTSKANTSKANTSKANTSKANTSKANTSKANTSNANTSKANTSKANTSKANTSKANTLKANTSKANTSKANTSKANTSKANTSKANTSKANTSRANRSKQNKSKSSHASLNEVVDVDVLLQQELNKEQQISNYLESMKSVNDSTSNTSKGNKSKANKSTPNRSRGSSSKANRSKANISKANSSSVNKSKANTSKANKTRELLMLVTETVEGEAPLQTSRIRNSSVTHAHVQSKDSESARKRSASELYGAHTLPIKKRSLVDTSQQEDKSLLPLKKRLLVHSTPVKGRRDVTMNASVLARVSPIRAIDDTHIRYTEQDTSITSTQPKENSEVRPKGKRGTRATTDNQETANATEFVKSSPKKTRERSKLASPKAKPVSPVKEIAAARTRRASPAKAKEASPIKSKKASPTKAKKASPAKAKKASPAKAKKASPVKTRKDSPIKTKKASPAKAKKASPTKPKKAILTKSKAVSPVKKASPAKAKKASPAKKPASPVPVKATRSRRNNASTLETNTKKRRASLVVAKKTPVMSPKPRATRKRKEPETTTTPHESPKKTRATRKNISVKEDKPKTPKSTRAKVQKATVVIMKPSPQLKPRTTRRAPADQSGPETKQTARNTRKTVTVQETKPESPKKSQAQRKSTKTQAAEVQPKTRGRKTVVSESKDTTEVEKPEPKPKRGRKADEPAAKKTKNNTQDKSVEEAKPVRGRGKKVEPQESVESVPSTRGRRGAKPDSIVPEVTGKTRKRKSDTPPDNELPSKVRKSKEVVARGTKRVAEVSTEIKNTRNKSAARESKEEKAPVKVTRGKKTAEVAPVKVTKQAEPKTLRGRKANIENVPATQVAGKRKRAAEPSPVKERKTRATRAVTQPEGKPAGRSRRR